MINRYLLLSLLGMCCNLLYGQVCNEASRYLDYVFDEADIEVTSIPFASFAATDLWNNGDTSSNCFKPTNYLTLETDGRFTMLMDVYRPSSLVDECVDRPAILFLHGGGYAHISGNRTGTNPVLFGTELARRGFVVFVMDYRKGWDIRNALSGISAPPVLEIPLLPGCQNCPCDGSECDDFSFVLATYRMVQDVKAAHREIILNSNVFAVDPSQVHYWGASTGSVGMAHAAYGGEAYANYENAFGESLMDIAGDIDAFGAMPPTGMWPQQPASIHLLSGAIKDLDYIDANDDVPAFFSHGSRDEAVPYCSGRILDMKYSGVNDFTLHLGVQGPGRMYRRFLDLADHETVAQLYTYNGLFHSFTPVLGNTNLNLNCEELRSLTAFLSPALAFTKEIVFDGERQNEHHRVPNAAATIASCNFIREDTSTQCAPLITSWQDVPRQLSINVYPNPGTGQFVLTIPSGLTRVQLANEVKLHDPLGRLVWHSFLSQQDLEERRVELLLNHIPPGVYWLQWGSFSKKVILQ